MSRKTLWLLNCIVFLIVLAGCAKHENKQSVATAPSSSETPKGSPNGGPPADVVLASAPQVEVTSGSSVDATVNVKVANGYHINGNPSSKFQIATALDIEKNEGITVGKANYPPSESKTFSFSNEPIMVYEGDVVIKQPLRADIGAAKGNRLLRAKLKVQPCDDTVCYPPRSLEVSIPIIVK